MTANVARIPEWTLGERLAKARREAGYTWIDPHEGVLAVGSLPGIRSDTG